MLRRAITATIAMSATANATRAVQSRCGFNRAVIIPWSMAAAGVRFRAAMAQTSIFETGFVTRRARCHGSISKAVRAITIAETATTKCDSAASGGCPDLIPHTGHAFIAYSARALL